MDLDTLLTLTFKFIPVIFALLCLYYCFYFLRSARNIEDLPSSKIRSASQGYAQFCGKAQSLFKEPNMGPLTKKPCAWFEYKIEKWVTTAILDGTTEGNWTVVEDAISEAPFLIEDGTGECAVFPKGANVFTTRFIRWRGHSKTPPRPPNSFLEWLFTNWGNYQYTEYRIELNSPIFIRGFFYTGFTGSESLQQYPFLAEYLLEKNQRRVNIITGEGQNKNEPFIVSTKPENSLVKQFKFKAFLFFIAFLFFSILTVHSTYRLARQSLQPDLKNWQLKIFY